jgi:DNA-binding NtrC family response regulator
MSPRILSISYDPALLSTRQQLLESRGYSVVSAEGFTSALEHCSGEHFDLVVMGHSIPHKDKEALLKAVNEGCKAPVVALVRTPEPSLKGAAESVDPRSPSDFLTAVEKILGKRST